MVGGFQSGFEQAKTGYERIKSKLNTGQKSEPLLQQIAQELKMAMLPHRSMQSVTRRYDGPVLDISAEGYEGSAALVAVQEPQSPFRQAMDKVRIHA